MFAVWLTGLPGSGKSTVARELVKELRAHGVTPAVLESDELRRVLTPKPTYTDEERETFYNSLVYFGKLLVEHGVPVIFDATANRRRWRDRARAEIPKFVEVFVDCPLEVCAKRDPKGLYRRAREGGVATLPGLQADYEPPLKPDVEVWPGRDHAQISAFRIVNHLVERGLVP